MKNLTLTRPSAELHQWRPLFWEPVAGTGERLMIGAVYNFHGEWGASRVIRDDVIAALYGQVAANGAIRLLEFGLSLFLESAKAAGSLVDMSGQMSGIHAGELRATEASSKAELLRIASLLYSSLASLDRFDEVDDADSPLSEEVTKRFSTELKDRVVRIRPDLQKYFGCSAILFPGGENVKFGFVSERGACHFNVVAPIRPGPSLRDARARLFELQRCKEITGLDTAVLISSVPSAEDPLIGDRQRASIINICNEIAGEAKAAQVGFIAVPDAAVGASKLISLVG